MKALLSVLLVGLMGLGLSTSVSAATTNLYSTHFEPGEGYNPSLDLIGQAGWTGAGSGGNGLIANGLQGQSAYIGFAAPDAADDSLVLWKPINFMPLQTGYPIVKFSVLLNVIDSQTTTNRDIFRWSIYNSLGDRLFSLDFDNLYLDIAYVLDGTNDATFTYLPFVNDSNYTLNVTMDFASNRWSATYNNIVITNNQPITTTGALLDFGDVDAVWLVSLENGTNAPGDNYMLFDNYGVTAESRLVIPAELQFRGRTGDGWAILRVFGANNSWWAVEATTNLVQWTALKTNQISGTYFDLVDDTAAGKPRRFYRARHVP